MATPTADTAPRNPSRTSRGQGEDKGRAKAGRPLLLESEATRRWSTAIGIDSHDVRIKTNAHNLTLLFSCRQVSEAPVGYTPFLTDRTTASLGAQGRSSCDVAG
ncbi:YxiG-like protein [Streptomyces smyrnaeus]